MKFRTNASVFTSFLERAERLHRNSPNNFDKSREFTLRVDSNAKAQGLVEIKSENTFYFLKEEHPCKLRKKGHFTFKFNATQVRWLKSTTEPDEEVEFEFGVTERKATLTTNWGQMEFVQLREGASTAIEVEDSDLLLRVDREGFQDSLKAFRGLNFAQMTCSTQKNRIDASPVGKDVTGKTRIDVEEITDDCTFWFNLGIVNTGLSMFTNSNELEMFSTRVRRPGNNSDMDEWLVFKGDDDFIFAVNSNMTKDLSEKESSDLFERISNADEIQRMAVMGVMLRNNLKSFQEGLKDSSAEVTIQAIINPDMTQGKTLATRTLAEDDDFNGFLQMRKLGCSVEVPLTYCSLNQTAEINLPLNYLIGFCKAIPNAENYLVSLYKEEEIILISDDQNTACWVFDCNPDLELDVEMDQDVKADNKSIS